MTGIMKSSWLIGTPGINHLKYVYVSISEVEMKQLTHSSFLLGKYNAVCLQTDPASAENNEHRHLSSCRPICACVCVWVCLCVCVLKRPEIIFFTH